MSVTVRHLNADSSFLLIFSPEQYPSSSDLKAENGAYSVLIDPWLVGSSIVTAPWFAITHRILPSCIKHLSEIEPPDIVVVSQNKPDHCHKETLLQLRPDGKTVIGAEPGAAKFIKSWNYFDPKKVHGLSKYEPRSRSGRLLQLKIPPLSPHGHAGEVNIAFIPAKNYVTGLHNAFGITYRPPTHTKSIAPVDTIELPRSTRYFHMPLSPVTLPPSSPPQPISPAFVRPASFDYPPRKDSYQASRSVAYGDRPQISKASNTASSEALPISQQDVQQRGQTPSGEHDSGLEGRTISPQIPGFEFENEPEISPFTFTQTLPTPPDSPAMKATTPLSPREQFHHPAPAGPTHQKSLSSITSYPNLSPVTPARPKALSIIYTPHGVSINDLRPYIQHHLVQLPGALPLTVLLHSFDHVQNPWYLGGNIMAGALGGVEIAHETMARCWISAHDELKDDQGFSVKKLKIKSQNASEVRKALWSGEAGQWLRQRGWTCDVRSLDSGKEMTIGQARDLCAGMEGNRDSRLMNFVLG